MSRFSAIYEGAVFHRRHRPVRHVFNNRLFMMYIDLDELPRLFDGARFWSSTGRNLASFRRDDFFGDSGISLKAAVLDKVELETGVRPRGRVRMLAHLRYFGHIFNPVTFYYVYSEEERLEAVLAEITNTPWKERHAYVLSVPRHRVEAMYRFRFNKAFHVSPFMDMDLQYDWRLSEPGDQILVRMENRRNGESLFDAGMTLDRKPITSSSLNRALMRYPVLTARIVAGIYLHAARLRLKGVPFFSHPSKREPAEESVRMEKAR